MKKRLFAIFVALCMVVSMLPVTVLAAEGDPVAQYTGIGTYATAVSEVKSAENAFVSVSGNIYRDGTKLSNSKIDNETYSITAIQYRDSGSSNEYSNVPEAWVSNKSDKYGSFYFVISQIPVGSYDIQITFDFTGTYNNGTKDTSDDENISVTGMAANTTLDVLPDVAVSSDPFVLEVSDVTASYADIGQTYLPIPFKAMCGTYDVSGVVEVRWELVEGVTMSDSDPDKQSDGSYTFGHLYPFANGICGTVQLKVWAVYGHYNYDQSYELIVDKTTKPATINVTMTDCDKMFAAQIGSTGYTTLAAAIAAAKNGDTVTLLADTSLSSTITVLQKTLNLDLNGHTITAQVAGGHTAIDVDAGSLTVLDSSSEKSGKLVSTYYGIMARNGGTIIMQSGTISSARAALCGNNTYGNMNFVVNGGTLTAQKGAAIYMPGQGSLTVTGGTLNGGISLRMGQVNISGGTINATAEKIDTPAEYYNHSSNVWFPDALYVLGGTYGSGDKTYGNSLSLNISGGTFNCANGQGSAVAVYDCGAVEQKMNVKISGTASLSTNASSRKAYQVLSLNDIGVTTPAEGYNNGDYIGRVTSAITGGTFSSDPTAYVAGGYIAKKNSETEYAVIAKANLTSGVYMSDPTDYTAANYYATDNGNGTWTVFYVAPYVPPTSTTETTTNENGSTTTTVTDKTTGTVTETTTSTTTDEATGTTTQTTTETVTAKDGTTTSTETVTATDASGSTGTTTTTTNANGETTVTAEAAVSAQAITEAAKTGEAVTLPVEVSAAASTETAAEVTVSVPAFAGSVSVEIPVTNTGAGVVAVKVNPDGTEEIIKTSVPTENGVVLNVEGEATIKIVDNSKDFTDVKDTDWHDDAVAFVSAREIMNGVGGDKFDPNTALSRGMIAQVLHNFENNPETAADNLFDDVSDDAWYTDAVKWAADQEIIEGSNGNYAPDDNITREQLAAILYRYAGAKGYDVTASGDLSAFTDGDQTASWAQEAMEWAVASGIFQGNGNSILNPKGSATRAEIAQILMNFCKNVVK